MASTAFHPLTEVVSKSVEPLRGPLRQVKCVLHEVCPVPFFGDAVNARIATVSLNRATRVQGHPRTNPYRHRFRLPTRDSLQIGDWGEATDETCSLIRRRAAHTSTQSLVGSSR